MICKDSDIISGSIWVDKEVPEDGYIIVKYVELENNGEYYVYYVYHYTTVNVNVDGTISRANLCSTLENFLELYKLDVLWIIEYLKASYEKMSIEF